MQFNKNNKKTIANCKSFCHKISRKLRIHKINTQCKIKMNISKLIIKIIKETLKMNLIKFRINNQVIPKFKIKSQIVI